MTSRFASLTEQDVEKVVEDKGVTNTKRSTKVAKEQIKQLLNSVFVISRIIKVLVRVISLSLWLRLITPTSTLIILDITKTSSNNGLKCCFTYFEIFHHLQKNKARIFLYFRKFSFWNLAKLRV